MKTRPTAENENRLSEALREWAVDTALPPRFQEGVWRRISQTELSPEPSLWASVVRYVAESFLRPRVAYSYIAILVALGMAGGAWTAQVKTSRMETVLGERYVQSVNPYQLTASNQ